MFIFLKYLKILFEKRNYAEIQIKLKIWVIVYGYLTPNRSEADFKILLNWKVLFDDEDQHTLIWGFSKIFDFFEKIFFTVF